VTKALFVSDPAGLRRFEPRGRETQKEEVLMLLKKLDTALSGCSREDKDQIALGITALAPHFA